MTASWTAVPSNSVSPEGTFWHPGLLESIQSQGTNGHFGEFGGAYVPEVLVPAVQELEAAYLELRQNLHFWRELDHLSRPSPYGPRRRARDRPHA
jgi:hypothetical protein